MTGAGAAVTGVSSIVHVMPYSVRRGVGMRIVTGVGSTVRIMPYSIRRGAGTRTCPMSRPLYGGYLAFARRMEFFIWGEGARAWARARRKSSEAWSRARRKPSEVWPRARQKSSKAWPRVRQEPVSCRSRPTVA